MSEKEEILINVIRLGSKEFCAIVLEFYIQRYGFLSNEAADEIRRILAEKDKRGSKRMTNGEMMQKIFPRGYLKSLDSDGEMPIREFFLDDDNMSLSCLVASQDWWDSEYKEQV